MNKKQLLIAWVAGLLVALAFIYPPWIHTFQAAGISQVRNPAGYHFIFTPPLPQDSSVLYGVTLDLSRLCIEQAVICVFGVLGILSLRDK